MLLASIHIAVADRTLRRRPVQRDLERLTRRKAVNGGYLLNRNAVGFSHPSGSDGVRTPHLFEVLIVIEDDIEREPKRARVLATNNGREFAQWYTRHGGLNLLDMNRKQLDRILRFHQVIDREFVGRTSIDL